MKKILPVTVGALLLGGCALPVPLQVATWAIDGFSYIVSEKSITDHGLSMVAEQDCALWRLITEGEICREEDAVTAIAAAEVENIEPDATANEQETIDAESDWSDPSSVAETVSPSSEPTGIQVDVPQVKAEVIVASTDLAGEGNYLVIGSFGYQDNAKGFARTHGAMGTVIIPAVVSGEQVYRVVVGPIAEGTHEVVASNLHNAGLQDMWSLRLGQVANTIAWKEEVDHGQQIAALPVTE